MRDLIYLVVLLLEGIDLLGIYCRVDHVMIAMNIRILFLYLYIYYFGGVLLDGSCSFTNAVIAAIILLQ